MSSGLPSPSSDRPAFGVLFGIGLQRTVGREGEAPAEPKRALARREPRLPVVGSA
jgi:hypothetical protein